MQPNCVMKAQLGHDMKIDQIWVCKYPGKKTILVSIFLAVVLQPFSK
jgi:hypothetical protein